MTVKMMEVCFNKMSVTVQQSAWHNISEDLYLQPATIAVQISGPAWL
jgi:hypothetical protein